jgi:hypothetical protein
MPLRLRGRDSWYAILWTDGADEDPAYRHGSASPLYETREALVADLGLDEVPIDDEMGEEVDVDRARALIGSGMSRDEIDVVITAWNSLDDLTKSLGVPLGFRGELANRSYDKLFWGLNLAPVTPPGQWYTPAWRPRELAKIDQVLRECGARVAAWSELRSPSGLFQRHRHRRHSVPR